MRSAPHLVLPGHHGWLVLALAIFALSKPGDIQAQQEPKQGKEAPAQTTPPPTPVIEIKIRTSGKRFVPGDPVGAMADITNKSNVPLYLRAGDVQFILALETNGGLSSCNSWFPNVTRSRRRIPAKLHMRGRHCGKLPPLSLEAGHEGFAVLSNRSYSSAAFCRRTYTWFSPVRSHMGSWCTSWLNAVNSL